MAKPAQILNIDPPNELTFKGPFTDVVTSYLELGNPSEQQICFKVKTTAPKQYCVRPNSGLIPPKGQVKVAVMLQPFDYSSSQEGSKHKFMVQSAYVPEGETSLDTIWKNVPHHELMDSKMRVVFDMPDANNVALTDNKSVPKVGISPQKMATAAEADFRKTIDENKRLQSDCSAYEKENADLRERMSRLIVSPGSSRSADLSALQSGGDIKLLHVILVGLAALFVGLILAKIF